MGKVLIIEVLWKPVNTDTKGTRASVCINRALRVNVTDTCFIHAKTIAYNLKATERCLMPKL